MINQALVEYIKQVEQKGFSKDQIRARLLKEGYKEEDIDYAFANAESFRMPPPAMPELPKRPLGISILAILYIIGGLLSIAFGVLLELSGTAYLEGVPYASLITGFITVIAVLLILDGFFNIFIGVGLWKLKRWARICAIVFSILGILSIIGALFSIIFLVILFRKNTKKAFDVS